jgi:hypothetical protein
MSAPSRSDPTTKGAAGRGTIWERDLVLAPASNSAAAGTAATRRAGFDQRLAWLLSAFFTCLYLASAKGLLEHGDDVSMFLVTESMVERGNSSVPADSPGAALGVDGRYYSKYGIGQSVLAIPLFLFGRSLEWLSPVKPVVRGDEGLARASIPIYVVSLLGALCTAATVALLFLTCRLLGCARMASLAAALALGLGTFAWHYARTFMSEPASTLAVLLAVYAALRFLVYGASARSGRTSMCRWLVLSGAAAGAAVLIRSANAAVALPLGVWLLWVSWRAAPRWRPLLGQAACWGLPVGAALAGVLLYNHLRFGAASETGYGNELQEGFSTPFHVGFVGLLLSPGKSIFLYAPILLACIKGWRLLRRTRPDAFVLLAAMAFTQLALHAHWYAWWGGGTWGPRFLLVVLPLLLVGLALRLNHGTTRVETSWLALLALLSVLVQVVSVLVPYVPYEGRMEATGESFHRLLWNPADSPLLAHARSLLHGEFPLDLAPMVYHFWPVTALQLVALAACVPIGWCAVKLCRRAASDREQVNLPGLS